MVKLVNKILSFVNSKFYLANIQDIEFVCNWCENNDVDCSVVGHPDGVMVVYVRSCQECGGNH